MIRNIGCIASMTFGIRHWKSIFRKNFSDCPKPKIKTLTVRKMYLLFQWGIGVHIDVYSRECFFVFYLVLRFFVVFFKHWIKLSFLVYYCSTSKLLKKLVFDRVLQFDSVQLQNIEKHLFIDFSWYLGTCVSVNMISLI